MTAAAAGAAGAFLSPLAALSQPKPQLGKITLGFGLDPVFAPHIVAMEKGWFKEAGFTEVATKSFSGGALAGEALLADEIQLWTPGNLPPISMAHTGVPIVVMGTNCIAAAADKLVARKDANIRNPEDLYKIKIGLLAGSTASAVLHKLAGIYRLDVSRLQTVNMPPPEQLAALNAGQIGAMLCWQPWGYRALQGGAAELIHSGVASGFAANKGAAVLVSATRSLFVTSAAFARRNPAALFAMMATLVRAQAYVASPANRDEVVGLVARETKQDAALVASIWDEYVFDPIFDFSYLSDMRAMTDYLVSSGRIKEAKDPLDYTYSGAIAAVNEQLVKLPGRWKP
ncbi:ABC transporter substrate-binding protein [Bosea sp. LjRoot90]|uniref:ABC transporter substrate-binding protein n=1 Tax=Bosea sp. LjRoot90 TaxID=3342342 RepID=UPI003ECD2E85